MHLRSATLIAFCDGEAGANRSRRIASHLSKCERCRHELQRIQVEKDRLSVRASHAETGQKAGSGRSAVGDHRMADRQGQRGGV